MEKNVIVVGATSGIGREVAILFAKRGYKVAVAGRREDKLEEVASLHDNIIAYAKIDVNSEDAPALLTALADRIGGMDIYFHSSGIGYQNKNLVVEKEMATVQTNALGWTRMITAAFHYFEQHKERKGHIAIISSIAGTKGLGAAPAYSATKRFQNTYTEALCQLARMRHMDISFTDIRPGFVETDLIKDEDYSMQLQPAKVARDIVSAIEKKQSIVVIDWRYRILVGLWSLIPRWLWVRINLNRSIDRGAGLL